jgi:hypothetical protein
MNCDQARIVVVARGRSMTSIREKMWAWSFCSGSGAVVGEEEGALEASCGAYGLLRQIVAHNQKQLTA